MDNWLMCTRLFLVLYCIVRYVANSMSNITLVLLAILVYISIGMLFYVFRNETLKKGFLFVSCAVLILFAIYVNVLFILLLPLNIVELVNKYNSNFYMSAIPVVLAAFFIDGGIVPEYLLISVFSVIIYMLSEKSFARINMLKKDNDNLREKNDSLYKRLDAGAEYENQVRYLSQLEERNSLAQKIHDKVGHAIAGSLIQLEAASVIIDKDREKSREIVNNVINVLKEGMENIRSTLRNIKPAPEQLGVNRLKILLDEFSMNNPIKASLAYKGSIENISHLQWTIIMDNVKEALTNALKYSAASAVKVDINVMNKLIRTEVKDNGIGAYTVKKGLGLKGMEERTENAGGKVIIDGSGGFSVITLLPVREVDNGNKSTDSR